MPKSKIILLNGVSSSGKTTLAKALQETLETPYLHVGIDAFLDMMPQRFDEGGSFAYVALLGPVFSGMYGSIVALAEAGNDLIVDHVMIEGEEPANWTAECLERIAPLDVLKVGVHCSLEELKRREAEREDRNMGLAEWQFTRIHKTISYDVEVDTTLGRVDECVFRILKAAKERGWIG
jgi:chloramphenicol 3-O phosphotransferase